MAEINNVIAEASQDLQTIEDFVNLPAGSDVRPRLLPSVNVGTLAGTRDAIFRAGGLPAEPFETKAEMQTDGASLPDGQLAQVYNEPANNGLYVKTAGVWQKSGYDIYNATIDSYSKLSSAKNLFNGVYGKVFITGDTSTTMSFTSIDGNARTAFVVVKPNTTYRILKADETDAYRVGLFKGKIASNAIPSRLVSRDNPLNGEVLITTQADETILAVTVALSKPTQKNIFIEEVGGEDAHIKLGKNLINPNYELGVAIIPHSNPALGISRYDDVGGGIIVRCNIKPNTTYTLSKEVSSRFKVFEIFTRPFESRYLVSSRTLFDNDAATQTTFTTGSDALMLIIYLSNSYQRPFIQLEEGSVKTTWEKYGYKLKEGISVYKDSKFPYLDPTLPTITADLQAAINKAENGVVYIPSGTYIIDHTIKLPSNSRIIGLGKVVFKLADDFQELSAITWRNLRIRMLVSTEVTSSNIYLENITIEGSNVKDFNYMHWGICMQGTGHILKNVSTDLINYIVEEVQDRRAGGNGWGLVFFNAKNCKVFGGSFTKGGYENIGTEDSEDILFDGIYAGEGWRTSVQFHKNSRKIRLVNSVVKQTKVTNGFTHAAVTFHGKLDSPVTDILINGCTIDSQVSDDISQEKGRGGIQSVEGNEHNVTISNSSITTNKDAITGNSEGAGQIRGWVISNNRIESGRESILIRGGSDGVITGNHIKAPNDIKQVLSGNPSATIGNFAKSGNLFIDTTT